MSLVNEVYAAKKALKKNINNGANDKSTTQAVHLYVR
jgi:hypothetical protein